MTSTSETPPATNGQPKTDLVLPPRVPKQTYRVGVEGEHDRRSAKLSRLFDQPGDDSGMSPMDAVKVAYRKRTTKQFRRDIG